MRCSTLLTFVGLTVFSGSCVLAEEPVGWRDATGKHVPDTESQKTSQGFGGKLILTSDADWAEKWGRPETPQFNTTETVALGETITALAFFTNPATDRRGRIRILCDVRVTRPDGSVSVEIQGAMCAQGRLEGSPLNVRLVEQVFSFVGEPGDATGIWIVEYRLTDTVRDASVHLRVSFDYVGDQNGQGTAEAL